MSFFREDFRCGVFREVFRPFSLSKTVQKRLFAFFNAFYAFSPANPRSHHHVTPCYRVTPCYKYATCYTMLQVRNRALLWKADPHCAVALLGEVPPWGVMLPLGDHGWFMHTTLSQRTIGMPFDFSSDLGTWGGAPRYSEDKGARPG